MKKSIICTIAWVTMLMGLCACNSGGGKTPPNTNTYSISGSVMMSGTGLAGVTVSIGTANTANTDASGNYTIFGLANGSYTVIPSRNGYTFTPASSAQAINGSNISNVNFTATAETAPQTKGELKILVALFNYADNNSQPLFLQDVKNLIVNNNDSLNNYIKETSSNKAWLNVDFLNWITLGKNQAAYTDNTGLFIADAIQALDSFIDLTAYRDIILIYSGSLTSSYCAEAGTSQWPFTAPRAGSFNTFVINLGTACLIYNNQIDKRLSQAIFEHEFGHNLGFEHSAAVDCPDSFGIPQNLLDMRSCVQISDPVSTMSTDIGQYNSVDKAKIGWIDASQIQDAPSSGEYAIDQVELESPGIKTIRIPIGNDKDGDVLYYWLEYRKGIGLFDNQVDSTVMDILHLNLKPKWYNSSVGWFYNQQFAFAEMLPFKLISAADLNLPFLDPYRGVKVELVEKTGTGADAKARVLITRSQLKVDPDGVINFGDIDRNVNTMVQKTITLTNTGLSIISLGSATITGDRNFTVGDNTCQNKNLNSYETCSITLIFTTQEYTPKLATLSVATNDSIRPSLALSLYGSGMGGTILSSATTVSFDNTPVGTSSTKTISVTSVSDNDIYVYFRDYTPDFGFAGGSYLVLHPNETVSIDVVFSPESVGLKSGLILFESTGPFFDTAPRSSINLIGVGE